MISFRPQTQCWKCSRFVAGRSPASMASLRPRSAHIANRRTCDPIYLIRRAVLILVDLVLVNAPAVNSGS